jgi:2-keto-4-pentenoate hydratase
MRPVSAQFPEATIEDAYGPARLGGDPARRGAACSATRSASHSKAMQSQLNVKEPDYGCLLDDTMFADGA